MEILIRCSCGEYYRGWITDKCPKCEKDNLGRLKGNERGRIERLPLTNGVGDSFLMEIGKRAESSSGFNCPKPHEEEHTPTPDLQEKIERSVVC